MKINKIPFMRRILAFDYLCALLLAIFVGLLAITWDRHDVIPAWEFLLLIPYAILPVTAFFGILLALNRFCPKFLWMFLVFVHVLLYAYFLWAFGYEFNQFLDCTIIGNTCELLIATGLATIPLRWLYRAGLFLREEKKKIPTD